MGLGTCALALFITGEEILMSGGSSEWRDTAGAGSPPSARLIRPLP
ncbi:hypothetical protein ACIA8E_27180 [Streptomyces sp. NPDC051664]